MTPRKVQPNENINAPRVKTNTVTTSSPQSSSTYRNKKKTQLAIVTSTLIASSSTSNEKSESVFITKRRPWKETHTQKVFLCLKEAFPHL